MKIIKNLIITIASILLSYNLCLIFGNLYLIVFPYESAGSFIDGTSLIGIPLAYIFSIAILFTAFGDKHKYWWMAILLFPAAFFEAYFDLFHIYFPIALGLLGWAIGFLVAWMIGRFKIDVGH